MQLYDYITTYDDRIYCDYECAQRDGYRYCEDTEDWRDEWYIDSYNDHYYAGTPYIETEESEYGKLSKEIEKVIDTSAKALAENALIKRNWKKEAV